MEAVQKSAEHHFLTNLHRLRHAPHGWAVLHFAFSKRLNHGDILAGTGAINKLLAQKRAEAEQEYQFLRDLAGHVPKGVVYLFDDNDIVLLAPYQTDIQKETLKGFYKAMTERMEAGLADFGILEHEFYTYQKLADQKFLSAKRLQAYRDMADRHKTSSIAVRRERRDHALVQVIEDDRFTASYTAGILHREYEMILSRNGEDAILQYIEHAPDIVFIDIHLPGLSGHEVLKALKIADPQVYAVMLSVDTVRDNIVRSAEEGANKFLKKPFSKERLLSVVKNSPYIQSVLRRGSASPLH